MEEGEEAGRLKGKGGRGVVAEKINRHCPWLCVPLPWGCEGARFLTFSPGPRNESSVRPHFEPQVPASGKWGV